MNRIHGRPPAPTELYDRTRGLETEQSTISYCNGYVALISRKAKEDAARTQRIESVIKGTVVQKQQQQHR
jgi:hypothetical protein